jgi:hypothetical protein
MPRKTKTEKRAEDLCNRAAVDLSIPIMQLGKIFKRAEMLCTPEEGAAPWTDEAIISNLRTFALSVGATEA